MPLVEHDWFRRCDVMPDQEGTPYSLDRKRNYTVRHQVQVKYKDMSPIMVCLCPGLPLPGSFYNVVTDEIPGGIVYDTSAICIKQSAKRKKPEDAGAWEWWIVTSEFSTDIPLRTDSPAKHDDPQQELPEVEWDFETMTVTRQHDLNFVPYCNSAGQLLTPGPQFEVDYPVLNITRNELTFNYKLASFYTRSLNDKPFLSAPQGCVQCLPPKSKQKNKGAFRYQRTSYKLRFRPKQQDGTYNIKIYGGYLVSSAHAPGDVPGLVATAPVPPLKYVTLPDTWQPLILNAGQYQLKTLPPSSPDVLEFRQKLVPIFRGPHIVHHPVILDQFGHEIKQNPSDVKTWYIQFKEYRYTSFTNLLLKGVG